MYKNHCKTNDFWGCLINLCLHNCQCLNGKIKHKMTSERSPNGPKMEKLSRSCPKGPDITPKPSKTLLWQAFECLHIALNDSKAYVETVCASPGVVFARKLWAKSQVSPAEKVNFGINQSPLPLHQVRQVRRNRPNIAPTLPQHRPQTFKRWLCRPLRWLCSPLRS